MKVFFMENKQKIESKPSRDEVENALAALIVNTRRTTRKLNLLEIASMLNLAITGLGNAKMVAEKLDLSEEMVRQFLSVNRLCPEVKGLIKRRAIDGVDIAHRLSKLSARDQVVVAKSIAKDNLSSEDVRAIIALKKSLPSLAVGKVIKKVISTKTIKRFMILFVWPSPLVSEAEVMNHLRKKLGSDGVISVSNMKGMGLLTISKTGRSEERR